jgi:hypothetical protein
MVESNILTSLVDETANLGTATASISLIISIIIGIILLIIAIYFGSQPQKPYVRALIKSSNCESEIRTINDKKETYYKCLLKLVYTINNVDYMSELTDTSLKAYNPNTYIDIEYDLLNPKDINIKGMDNSTISSIFMVIGIIIIGFSYGNYYLTTKSKAYASMHGISTIGSFFSNRSRY